jgi:hypothetical protein
VTVSNAIARRPCVVHEHVDLAEVGCDLLVRARDVGGLGDVADVVAHLEAVLRKRRPRQLQVIGTAGKNGDPGAWRCMVAI